MATTPISRPQDDGYGTLLAELKERTRTARPRAAFVVYRWMVQRCGGIGRAIQTRQTAEGRVAGVIDRLAARSNPIPIA